MSSRSQSSKKVATGEKQPGEIHENPKNPPGKNTATSRADNDAVTRSMITMINGKDKEKSHSTRASTASKASKSASKDVGNNSKSPSVDSGHNVRGMDTRMNTIEAAVNRQAAGQQEILNMLNAMQSQPAYVQQYEFRPMPGYDYDESQFIPDYSEEGSELEYACSEAGPGPDVSPSQGLGQDTEVAGPSHSASTSNDNVNAEQPKDGNETSSPTGREEAAQPFTGFGARFQASSPTGPAIKQSLAEGVNRMLSKRLEDDKLKETMDKYLPPSNVARLVVPKVNSIIWENIPAKTKTRDLKLQRLQKPLVKAMVAFVKQLPEETNPEHEEVFALLAHANFEINMHRRESVKPDLNVKYHHLCKPEVEVTEYLFGNDLGKVVKDMTEQHKTVTVTKLGMKLGNRGRGRGGFARYTPYPHAYQRPSPRHHAGHMPAYKAYPQQQLQWVPVEYGRNPNMQQVPFLGQRQSLGMQKMQRDQKGNRQNRGIPATQTKPQA